MTKHLPPNHPDAVLAAVNGNPLTQPDPPRRDSSPRPDRIADILVADERAELLKLAEGVSKADAEQHLASYRLEQASEGTLVLLDERERAAARLLDNELRIDAHRDRLAREASAARVRLDDLATNPALINY